MQETEFRPLADGLSFVVEAKFRDEVPQPFADAGTKLGHSARGAIDYQVLGWAGNIEQTGPNKFRVAFDREGVNGRTVHVVIGAVHHGDAEYRETVASTHFFVPSNNAAGTNQTITFPPLADVPAGTASVRLNATTDSGLPVRYYVSWGPAEVDGSALRLTPIPAKAKFPVAIKVTAYQWGNATEPKIATAAPVTRVFHITANQP